ncbi:MAG: hypothetical protein U0Q18_32970 [Bryobacteraceae bacterium]
MKLRIQGNSLRFRLTRSEVATLDEGGLIAETTHFGIGHPLTYRLRKKTDGVGVRAELADGVITVSAPAGEVHKWATSDEVGITARDGVLRIAIEKDFRCLTHRDEDAADAYPHPVEQARC